MNNVHLGSIRWWDSNSRHLEHESPPILTRPGLHRFKDTKYFCTWVGTGIDVKISNNIVLSGREPWSSGYGKRLTFWRLWVRILAPYTGWTFLYKKYIIKKKRKNKIKEKKNIILCSWYVHIVKGPWLPMSVVIIIT